MTRSTILSFPLLASLGTVCLGCSAPPQGGVESFGGRPTETEEEPFDPRAPLASIICYGPGGADPAVYVVSSMNHKLEHYPEFAEAFGAQEVRECDGAVRFEPAYADYLAAHPGFDADEPLPPSPEDEATEPADYEWNDSAPELPKVGNAPGTFTDSAIVNLEFETCASRPPKNGVFCAAAPSSWIINGKDLRRNSFTCSGTFISKNWILTAAHCITFAAIDGCLEAGKSPSACNPAWDNYGKWVIEGTYTRALDSQGQPTGTPVTYREVFGARAYVDTEWRGTRLDQNGETCTTNCVSGELSADHDLALLYIGPNKNDSRLPPRVEDDAAKRLNIAFPKATWSFSVAGWGDPAVSPLQQVFRKGVVNSGNITYPQGALSTRMDVATFGGDAHVCHGDSGGPVLRTGLSLTNNRNFARTNLEAIVAVNATSNAHCDGTTEPSPIVWRATLVHTTNHRKFIHDSMNRWPWTARTCVEKKVNGGSANEVEECWGKPCTFDGNPCTLDETCQGKPRETTLPTGDSMCKVCQNYPGTDPVSGASLNASCNCIEGECVKDQ